MLPPDRLSEAAKVFFVQKSEDALLVTLVVCDMEIGGGGTRAFIRTRAAETMITVCHKGFLFPGFLSV